MNPWLAFLLGELVGMVLAFVVLLCVVRRVRNSLRDNDRGGP